MRVPIYRGEEPFDSFLDENTPQPVRGFRCEFVEYDHPEEPGSVPDRDCIILFDGRLIAGRAVRGIARSIRMHLAHLGHAPSNEECFEAACSWSNAYLYGRRI